VQQLRRGGGRHTQGGHELLQGFGKFRVAGQGRHLVLPQVQVPPRQFIEIRLLRHRHRV